MATILVVDDSSFARKRLKQTFENAGHTVVGSAANGEQALSLYSQLQPEVVTLDYLMVGKDGMQVLKEIIDQDPNARVIVISGSGNHAIESEFLSAGAMVYVEKLNNQDEYLKAVDQVMQA